MHPLLSTPKRRATLLAISNLLWLALIPAQIFYFSRKLTAGAFPENADSISIPIIESAVSAIILSPVLNGFWLLLSHRYPGPVSLAVKVKCKWYIQIISALLTTLTLLLVYAAILGTLDGELEMAVVIISWCYLVLSYRAVFLASHKLPHVTSV